MTETIAMYDEAINMLEDTLTAFEKEDTQLARSVFQKDEFLDKININATNATCEYLVLHPEDAYQALINLSVIRRMERWVISQKTSLRKRFFMSRRRYSSTVKPKQV